MSKRKQEILKMQKIAFGSDVNKNSIKMTQSSKDAINTVLNFEIGMKKSLFKPTTTFNELSFYDCIGKHMIIMYFPSINLSDITRLTHSTASEQKDVLKVCRKFKDIINKEPLNHYVLFTNKSFLNIPRATDLINISHDFLKVVGRQLSTHSTTSSKIKKLISCLQLVIDNYVHNNRININSGFINDNMIRL